MKPTEFTCIEPDYVKDFFCDGSKCGGSLCCYGWQQILDEAALTRYRKVTGVEGERLRAGLVYLPEAEGFGFRHDHDHCVFLREDGLCSLQKKYGAEMLTDVCAEYPRKTRLFPQCVVERALCVTCPVAADLILQNEKPLRFVHKPMKSTRMKYFQAAGDADVLEQLDFFTWQGRGIAILQNRNLSLPERLQQLLAELAEADEAMPWGRDAEKEIWQPWPPAKQASFFRAFVEGIEDHTDSTASYLSAAAAWEQKGFMPGAEATALLKKEIWHPYGMMLENYLVNEWFKELYPCAVLGTFAYNGLYFAVQWEIWQFLLLLSLLDKQVDVLQAVRETAGWLASRLNHYTAAPDVLAGLLQTDKG
ncbi:MAG: flagellin lysine-N-methylase [Selenomonas sp.]|uniref:flagellin lysine-N-methylase n=1 Tax=Selenomonas sp. TaxID=2053611 RepID=UPI0025D9E0D4|nr:flagellin lysine-N-methylase [Selenomonas sp.]MCR5756563.1 flagellin lysine-N-methylase [Selenomonas sp.]